MSHGAIIPVFDIASRAVRIDAHTLATSQVEDLRQAGLEPYAYRFDRTHYTSELQEQYKSLADGAEDEAGTKVAVSGRVMAKRVMGKLAFLSLRDDRAQIQVRN